MKKFIQLTTPWLLLLLMGLFVAWLRYGIVESSAIGQLCSSGQRPTWCAGRQWLVLGFLNYYFGYLALAASVLALYLRRSWAAWLAAATGLLALQLYCVEAGALALLVGSLRLLRLQMDARTPPLMQHGHGQQQIQAQPDPGGV